MTTLPIDRLHAAVLAAEPPAPFRVERSERGGFVVKHINGSELRGLSCGMTAAAFVDTANAAYALGWSDHEKAIADAQRILPSPVPELCAVIRSLIACIPHCSKPIGSPGSDARNAWQENESAILAARQLLARVEVRP